MRTFSRDHMLMCFLFIATLLAFAFAQQAAPGHTVQTPGGITKSRNDTQHLRTAAADQTMLRSAAGGE